MAACSRLLDANKYAIAIGRFHGDLAYKAAHSPECCLMIDNALDCLGTQLQNLSTSAIWMKTHDVMSKKMLTHMCSKVINFSVLQS